MGDQVDTAEPHFHGLCRIVLNNADIKPDLRESIMFKSFIEYQRDTGYCARSSELPFILCHTILWKTPYIYTVTNITCQQKGHVDVYNTDQ